MLFASQDPLCQRSRQFMFRPALLTRPACAYQTCVTERLETNLVPPKIEGQPLPQIAQNPFVQFDEEKGTFCTNRKITDVPQPHVIEI